MNPDTFTDVFIEFFKIIVIWSLYLSCFVQNVARMEIVRHLMLNFSESKHISSLIAKAVRYLIPLKLLTQYKTQAQDGNSHWWLVVDAENRRVIDFSLWPLLAEYSSICTQYTFDCGWEFVLLKRERRSIDNQLRGQTG